MQLKSYDLLLALIPALLLCHCFAQTIETEKYLVYAGTFSAHGSQGIYSYRFDSATGTLSTLALAAESADPAFLALSKNRKFLYAANEISHYNGKAAGAVSAFAIDSGTGKLSLLNQISSLDEGPAYVGLDRTGKYLFVANYPKGSVAVFRVHDDGRIGESSAFVRHQGSGVDPERQEGPHPHAIEMSPDNRFALVPDLGLDQLFIYPFEASAGTLGTPHIVKIDPGSGPRHLTFDRSGKFVYLLTELRSTVVVFSYRASDGALRPLQTISTLPKEFNGKSTASEIAVDPAGNFLYASNRGSDSIAVFKIDRKDGTLALVEIVPTQGKTPRNFAIDPSGSWLLAANQESNTIVLFRIDAKTGRLTATGQVVPISDPACLTFVALP